MLLMIKKYSKILFLILILQSCERKNDFEKDKNKYESYYKFLDKKGQLRFYFQKKTHFEKGLRIDTIFTIKKNETELERIEIYRCDDDKLYHVDSHHNEHLYFIKKDTCIQLIVDDDLIETCFMGYEDIAIDNKKFYKLLKFKKEYLSIDGITTHVYFDENYNIIREEFIEGYQFYFRIDKTMNTIKHIN